jgi:NADPH-dependent curcumin reductase CurA
MTSIDNTRIVLAARPRGEPKPGDFHLEVSERPVPVEGEVLLRVLYLSLDPYMRGRMDDVASYVPPIQLGAVMEAGTVGEVIESRHPGFRAGDIVLSNAGWQSYAIADGETLKRKLDPTQVPLPAALGVFGMPGFTAYAGLREIGKPQPGETVVVAAASGPVGATVGQIARLAGARAVGIAGGEKKCAYVRDELGFDAVVDHRAPDFAARLAAACPDGIDVYFENVGGAVWAAVQPLLNEFARVPLCGLVSQYNGVDKSEGPDRLPDLMTDLLKRSITVRGFINREFLRLYPAFIADMGAWLREGQIKHREDIVVGLKNAPAAFIGMLKGENFGKLVVRVADPDDTSSR